MLFGSVVAVAFQSTFRAEMHQNDVFFIFKKLFLKSAHQNNSKHTKKKLKFFGHAVCTAFPNVLFIARIHTNNKNNYV
jgi:hypothetical protein